MPAVWWRCVASASLILGRLRHVIITPVPCRVCYLLIYLISYLSTYARHLASPPTTTPVAAVCASLVAAQAAMQNLATSIFNTVALEPTYDAQPGPNVPLQGGSATGVMQPMKRTTILFHTLFKVACLPADAGRANPTARCSPAGPTHAAGFGPPHVRLRVVDLR